MHKTYNFTTRHEKQERMETETLISTRAAPSQPATSFRVALKTEEERERETDKVKSAVVFDESVAVFPIPNRSEYTPQMKSCIWSNKRELQKNAARNMLEFAAEGFNWRNAADDDAMYVNHVGERVHPCHCPHLYWKKHVISRPELARPIPQRTKHPSEEVAYSVMEEYDFEPIARPITPSKILFR
jgi:hypothetical protein